ncbi:hypothetical protein Pmani_037003 [Petrolisthes manimaculis]|uniref:Uncharacterized protein n=1 Tax=Petrolisthes manimaculis TaxID=1843537 RepID=A0AAE1TNS3_9EUCA|nr:hypothetical protein Pmani_037003 [Petrolisthes manimaculis]
MKRALVVGLVAVASFVFAMGEEKSAPNLDTTDSQPTVGDVAETKNNESPVVGEVDKNRFIGRYSTTTETAVVMVTSTVFFSCLSGTSGALCLGRRRKRALRSNISFEHERNDRVLETSQVEETTSLSEQGDATMPSKEKEDDSTVAGTSRLLGFQVWTRVRSTTTVTMIFTDTNTTIRLSFFCQAGLAQLPTFNCAG